MRINGIHIELCPIFGLLFGILYYDPNLDVDQPNVNAEDFYQQITFCLLFIGIKITWW